MTTAYTTPRNARPGGSRFKSPRTVHKSSGRELKVFYAAVWLVFLLAPALFIWYAPVVPTRKAFAWVSIIIFVIVYVLIYRNPRPLQVLGAIPNLLLLTTVLLVPILGTVPAIGIAALSMSPYILSIWTFLLPLRQALAATVIIVAAVLVLAFTLGHGHLDWILPMIGISAAVMIPIRALTDQEDREQELRRELALSHQREALARDVHDVLGHSLTVVNLKTQLAQRLVDQEPERAKSELDEVLALSREALAEVRATVGSLRAPEFPVQVQAARTALTTAQIQPVLDGDPNDVDPEHRSLFAWILREAVTNVVRHSNATACTVRWSHGALTVEDNGAGIGPTPQNGPVPGSGNGLSGMRERVELAGGQFEIRPASSNGTGTVVKVSMP